MSTDHAHHHGARSGHGSAAAGQHQSELTQQPPAHQHAGAQHSHGTSGVSWADAARATLHCLIGCAIGEVLGMVIGTALGLSNIATIALAIVLAFFFGYALTMRSVLKTGLTFAAAVPVVLAADTVSITVMEIIDNLIMMVLPGAMDAGIASLLFWGALAFALAAAFVITVPVNKWMIGRGKGHAVVHSMHH